MCLRDKRTIYSVNFSNSQKKAIRNLEKIINEHKLKLEKYKKNPYQFDNKNFLQKAPNDEICKKIIESRINHLEKEIEIFEKNISDILRK